MKKLFILFSFHLCFLGIAFSQVIPKGMNYQAVARNDKGGVLADQAVDVKIILFSYENNHRVNYYTESHTSKTSSQGLFDVVIGEGNDPQGAFGLIPWNKENIWLEVSLRDKISGELHTINNSRLMAVPYAMHVATADKIVETGTVTPSSFAPPEPGVISTEWSLLGNAKTDASGNIYRINSLGTSDYVDLIMITDNVERMRILAGGDIKVKLNFDIGQNLMVGQNMNVMQSAMIGDSLTVKKNVLLNVTGGSTIVCGPFTVANYSPTLLTGSLTVEKQTDLNTSLNVDGVTNLNSYLTVSKKANVKLSGTLRVDGVTCFNSALNVNDMAPVAMSGMLRVNKIASFFEKFKILSTYQTDTSGIMPTGALQVTGGAYIKENFYVGGIAKFGGPVAFGGPVSIQDATQSVDPFTGALKVAGGVGIGLNLNVGGMTMVNGMTTIKDLTESTDYTTGALKVRGGVGILKRLNVAGITTLQNTLTVQGPSYLSDVLNVTNGNNFIATFENTNTNGNGISIQVNNAAPGHANNFVEFRNSSAGVVGRIEGENSSEYMTNPYYLLKIKEYDSQILIAQLTLAGAATYVASATAGIIAAAASTTVCVGFGVCATTPIPSLIIESVIELGLRIPGVVMAAIALDMANGDKDDYIDYKANHIGVTYESGTGDYAEWLPRLDPKESFEPGQIVGLNNGKITKNIKSGDRLLVISTKPIVLGNTPPKSAQDKFEKVAFLGQIPVEVWGIVHAGDYILASGRNDGMGIPVSPDKMRIADYARIVGVAWSDAEMPGINRVNVALGLHTGDIAKEIIKHEQIIKQLEDDFKKTNGQLAVSIPGYKEAMGISPEELVELARLNNNDDGSFNKGLLHLTKIPDDAVDNILSSVQKSAEAQGMDIANHPVWIKLNSDPAYKSAYMKDIQAKYQEELQKQLEKYNPVNSNK